MNKNNSEFNIFKNDEYSFDNTLSHKEKSTK